MLSIDSDFTVKIGLKIMSRVRRLAAGSGSWCRQPWPAADLRGCPLPTHSGQSSLCYRTFSSAPMLLPLASDICRGRGDFSQALPVVAILDSPASGV